MKDMRREMNRKRLATCLTRRRATRDDERERLVTEEASRAKSILAGGGWREISSSFPLQHNAASTMPRRSAKAVTKWNGRILVVWKCAAGCVHDAVTLRRKPV